MPKVWVVGSGQLGAMMRHAAEPLGVDVLPIGADDDVAKVSSLQDEDFITPEIELWPSTPATESLAAHQNFINRDVFPVIADRKTQKQTLDDLDIATADWLLVNESISEEEVLSQLGDSALLKKRQGGYDGRGQYWLKTKSDEIPQEFRNTSIAESAIDFSAEVSIIGVRNKQGDVRFYPLSHNHHVDGILKVSIGNSIQHQALQSCAEDMLHKVMQHLDYIGVMAMECFVVNDDEGNQQLVVNELAPRVHNSGHWTQAGSSICQFESHIRAIVDLPIGTPSFYGQTVMINLVGTEFNAEWLNIQGASVYWYQKEVRAGRKLGHINLVNPSPATLNDLAELLPGYEQEFDWLNDQLEY